MYWCETLQVKEKPAAAATAKEEVDEKVKGLPSLGPKPKKKATES